MVEPFDFDDDGQVSPEEEAMAFLLLMDDDEEDELENSHGRGCLPMVLLIVGGTAAAITLPFLM